MRNQLPLLSCVIPIRGNSEDLSQLKRIRSSPPSKHVEWILVIDGEPTALVYDAAEELTNRPDVNILAQSCMNPGSSRNAGLAVACGDFVAFLDVDDEACVEAYVSLCRDLTAHRVTVGVVGYCEVGGESSSPRQCGVPSSGLQVGWSLLRRRVGIWRFVFSRAFLQRANVSFPESSYGEDLQFIVCVLTHSSSVWGVPRIGYKYRQHLGPRLTRQSPSASDVRSLLQALEDSLIANSANPAARHILQSWLARIWVRSQRLGKGAPTPKVRIDHAVLIARGLVWSCIWALREPGTLVRNLHSNLFQVGTNHELTGE